MGNHVHETTNARCSYALGDLQKDDSARHEKGYSIYGIFNYALWGRWLFHLFMDQQRQETDASAKSTVCKMDNEESL